MKKIYLNGLSIIGFILFALNAFGQNAENQKDTIIINWGADENWHIGDQQRNASQSMIELLKGDETFDNWTELGTTYIFRLKMNIAIKDKMDELYQRVKSNCPSAQMKIIEKDDKAKYPWYIYKIECSSANMVSESQVWYAVQTKNELYVSFISIKQKTIPSNFQNEWVEIFKSSKIISQ